MNALPDRIFVGRKKELARIRDVLGSKRNLVLTGPFGIGRTAILRHLQREMKADWRFVFLDGSQTPGKLCECLLLDLFPTPPTTARRSSPSWKVARHSIESRPIRDRRAVVIVLDDIAKVTHQKMKFLCWLNSIHKFQIVAVAERFLPGEDLIQIRGGLSPAPMITLGNLSLATAQRFFEAWAQQHELEWGHDHIHGLALATRGYPLGMQGAAVAAMALTR